MANACGINRETVSNGIQQSAKRSLDASGLFDVQDSIYTPKDEESNYKEAIQEINRPFGEEIVMPFYEYNSYTIADPSDQLIDAYLKVESVDEVPLEIDETLTKEQDARFKKLQDIGLISKESKIVNGKEYYKIPSVEVGRNFEAKDRLETIIQNEKIDWMNVVYGLEDFFVQLGQVTKLPESVDEPTTPSKSSTVTKGRVLRFLDAIGFRNIQTVSKLIHNGKSLEGSAYIDFSNAVMQIVEGTEDYTLTEEAMHILVELVKESRPELYQQMFKQIVNYKIYRNVVNDPSYTDNPLYRIDDGYNPITGGPESHVNYDKLKDEAIAKMLVEHLVNSIEGTEESLKRAAEAYNWWQQILKWIRETFGKVKNPFKQTLDELNNDDTTFGEFANISSDDIFLSAKSVDQIDRETPDNKTTYDTIKSFATTQGITKIGSEYFKDGQKVAESQRVSALTAYYYKKLFGDRNFDEAMEEFYEQSRLDGTYLHEVFEEVINSWIDPQTGLMRRNAARLTFPLPDNPVNIKMARSIQTYIMNYMRAYPAGTRFITEQVIFDPTAVNKDGSTGRYGTIDFIAILPDGKVDIIDWKSMLMQDIEGAKDYKREGIFIQLNEYQRILKSQYGVEEFGKLRAIPIRKHYRTMLSGKKVLMTVEIGDPDASKIEKETKYLRPIISPLESTGSESRDEIVGKLEALYQKYIEKGYFQKDRNILVDVQEAIYEIRTTNSVDNLANYFTDLRTKFVQLIGEQKALLEKGSKDDIAEALAMITFYEDIIDNVVSPAVFLQEDPSIDKESRNKLYKATSDLNFLLRKLVGDKQGGSYGMRGALLESQAKNNGIFHLLVPEKVVNLARRLFRSMGSQNIASVRYMYELVKKSYNRIDFESDKLLKQLKNLKSDFDKWAKTNNKTSKEAVSMIIDFEKAKIHSKIDGLFYLTRDKVVESKDPNQILQFVKTHYDMTEYNAWYQKTLEENKKIWEASTYDMDPKKNAQIIKSRIKTFEQNYNIYTHPVTAYGFHNTRIWTRNLKEENWYSKEYKELLKQGNEPLLAMYDFMVSRNKELAETGSIRDYEAYTYIPNVKKTFADILSFDDTNFLEKSKDVFYQTYNNWRRSLSVEDYELNYQGQRDPFTGEKLNKRFVPYVAKIDNEFQIKVDAAVELKIIKDASDTEELNTKIAKWRKISASNDKAFSDAVIAKREISFDIFTMYGLMSKEIQKEKYLSENDEILRSLLHIEKSKPNLLQNKFGTISTDANGKPEKGKEVGKNAPILEEHIRAVVNGEKIQYDADYAIQFKLRQKWNNSPLGKMCKFDISPETYNPTSVSLTKFLLWANTANQKRVLGLNAASAISNLFGGSFSSTKLYQKYTSQEDIKAAWLKMTSGGFYQSEEMKKNAALVDYFLPLLQNREAFKASQLSVNDAAKILSQEWLMAPMRKTSETVQLNIFLALIENTAVIEGKLINVREQAALDTKYADRYTLDPAKRAAVEKAFKDRIKELKEKYSLKKAAQFKTIQEGGKDKVIIEIPGVDRDSADVEHLREITQTMSKDSLGEADEFDIANYKYSIWWRLFMTFKNWIPRMADVRYGEFRYDQAHHSYEYGRFRMFARSVSANWMHTVLKLVPVPYLTGKATGLLSKEDLIQRARKVYLEKVEDAKLLDQYDPKTFITEGEFVDRFVQGTEATFAELRTMTLMMLMLFIGIAAPDDDDDSSDKAYKALIRKQMNKLIDEVGFFYSPKSGIDIAGGGAPVFSLVRDTWYLGSDMSEQFFGFTFEQVGWDEKGIQMQESAKPIKRAFKVFPVLKEILTYLPAVDEETAKEWGVKVSDRRSY